MISFPAGSRPTVEWYRTVARLYLPSAMGYYATDAERFAWQAGLVFHPGGAVVDVGSGFSPFVLGLQLLGMQGCMVDRFDYPMDSRLLDHPQVVLDTLRTSGVQVREIDIDHQPLPFRDESADAVTCVHMIEHLHH